MISIIVPVYNVEQYLRQCIDSLLNQTFSDYEIILINDGSTDSSGLICDEYVKQYKNIQVIHKANEGLGFARNTGLQYANGEYVTFIDSDDWAENNLLEQLYKKMKKENLDACIGGFKKVNNSGEELYSESYEESIFFHNGITNEIFIRMLGSSPHSHDAIKMSVWNSMYKMSIIKKYNLTFPSEREFISEDIIFDYSYFKFVEKAMLIPSTSYCYRTNLNSLTQSYRKDRFDKTIFLYQYLEEKLLTDKFDSDALLRLFRMFFVYIRVCINQENTKISKLTLKQAFNNIKKICSNKYLISKIESYPINFLGIKQKIFLYSIKYKLIPLLYYFS